MIKLPIILLVLTFITSKCIAQVNVTLLHQLVAASKSEYDKQSGARSKQAVNAANEAVNKVKMAELKSTYRSVQQRFSALGPALEVTQITLQARPVMENILSQQALLFTLVRQNPLLLTVALEAERDIAEQAELLVRYLYGLLLSAGDLNQMKASDRKLLFFHVLTELRNLEGACSGLVTTIQYYLKSLRDPGRPFKDFIESDKRLVDEIIRKTQYNF